MGNNPYVKGEKRADFLFSLKMLFIAELTDNLRSDSARPLKAARKISAKASRQISPAMQTSKVQRICSILCRAPGIFRTYIRGK